MNVSMTLMKHLHCVLTEASTVTRQLFLLGSLQILDHLHPAHTLLSTTNTATRQEQLHESTYKNSTFDSNSTLRVIFCKPQRAELKSHFCILITCLKVTAACDIKTKQNKNIQFYLVFHLLRSLRMFTVVKVTIKKGQHQQRSYYSYGMYLFAKYPQIYEKSFMQAMNLVNK